MKTHHQNTWQFAKLFLAALVFALGMVACGGGGGGGGGGTSAGINPSTGGYQLAIKSVSIEAAAAAPVESSGAGTLSARSAFVIAANADFILSVTVENTGKGTSPANTSFVLYRSDDKATLEAIGDVVGTYAVGAVGGDSERVITQVITDATLSTDSTKPTRFIVEGQFAGETVAADGDDEAVSNDYLGVEVYTNAGGSVVNEDDLITGTEIVAVIDYDWSATGATAELVGDQIAVSVVVTNLSEHRADKGATLSFYRSGSSPVTTSDTGVGMVSISRLAAGGKSTESIEIPAPTTEGTYYYGACIVSDDDSTANNNCATDSDAVVLTKKYGVVAFDEIGDEWFGDASVNQSTVADAYSEAIRLCVADGGSSSGCEALVTFTAHAAYAGGVKIGDDTKAILAWATGNTLARAESAALAKCEAEGGATSGAYACAPLGNFSDEYDNSHSNSPAIDGTETSGYREVVFALEQGPVAARKYGAVAFETTSTNFVTGTGTSVNQPTQAAAHSEAIRLCVDDGGSSGGCEVFVTFTAHMAFSVGVHKTDRTKNVVAWATANTSQAAKSAAVAECRRAGGKTSGGGACTFYDEPYSNSPATDGAEDVGSQLFVFGWDFGIELSADDSTLTPSQSFTLSAVVGSWNASATPATTLTYYLSSDFTLNAGGAGFAIDSGDTRLGIVSVPALFPEEEALQSISLAAPSTAGTYYYIACVPTDGLEQDPDDNCDFIDVTVSSGGDGDEFDVSVTAFSVSSASVSESASITLSATVGNASSATVSSPATTSVYYFRSPNSTISIFDNVVATDSVGALAAAETSNETVSISVPSIAGTYYYGACTFSNGDSNEGNDCSAGSQVVVGASVAPTTFDLSVTAFSVSKSSIVAGEAITLNATVTNASSATASSPVATLKYYRSTDATITSTDTEVGTADSISALAASATESETATDSPSVAGTYYYGACVVGTGDSDTTNNCSAGTQVDVAARDFDLSVTAFSVSKSSIVAGEAITLNATVGNDSSAMHSSPAATLKYYRSSDATIDATDTEVGTSDSISALAAAATESETTTDSPSVAGTYYYGACVVGTGDSDTTNNCSAGMQVVVAARDFDLSVTAFTVSSSSVFASDSITLNATVANDSSAMHSSPATTLRYYRSSDATIDASDTQVATDSVGALASSATSNETASVSVPSSVGTYYYGACVAATGDSDTSNNCSAGVQVTVAAAISSCTVGQVLAIGDSCRISGNGGTLVVTWDGSSITIGSSNFGGGTLSISGSNIIIGGVSGWSISGGPVSGGWEITSL